MLNKLIEINKNKKSTILLNEDKTNRPLPKQVTAFNCKISAQYSYFII